MCVVAVFNIHRSFVLACKTSVVLHWCRDPVFLQGKYRRDAVNPTNSDSKLPTFAGALSASPFSHNRWHPDMLPVQESGPC